MASKPCKYCGAIFQAKNSQVFCCAHCSTWSRIEKRGEDECWPWLGRKDSDGYGQHVFMGSRFLVHRFVAKEKHGDFGDLCALHSCDNPQCCNPKHLRPGTQKDNGADKTARKRGRTGDFNGEKHPQSKLSVEQVLEIRALSGSVSRKTIAGQFGLSKNHVSDIIHGRRWKVAAPLVCDSGAVIDHQVVDLLAG